MYWSGTYTKYWVSNREKDGFAGDPPGVRFTNNKHTQLSTIWIWKQGSRRRRRTLNRFHSSNLKLTCRERNKAETITSPPTHKVSISFAGKLISRSRSNFKAGGSFSREKFSQIKSRGGHISKLQQKAKKDCSRLLSCWLLSSPGFLRESSRTWWHVLRAEKWQFSLCKIRGLTSSLQDVGAAGGGWIVSAMKTKTSRGRETVTVTKENTGDLGFGREGW